MWTKIGPGGFLVVDNTDFGPDFLMYKMQLIELQDANGKVVDKTTYNKIKDGWSWARLAPGWDTDSKNDWYIDTDPSTCGSQNSQSIPEYQDLLLPLGIVVFLVLIVRKTKRSGKSKKD
jgi:hypothetical protein